MAQIEVKAVQQDVYNINGDNQVGRGYVMHLCRYTTIEAEDIVKYCSESQQVPKAQVMAAMTAVTECIRQYLLNGHSVELPNLGIFSLTSKSTCVTDVNKVGIDQLGQFNIRFRPSVGLKKELNKIEPVLVGIYDIANEYPDGSKDYVPVQRHKRGRKKKSDQL